MWATLLGHAEEGAGLGAKGKRGERGRGRREAAAASALGRAEIEQFGLQSCEAERAADCWAAREGKRSNWAKRKKKGECGFSFFF